MEVSCVSPILVSASARYSFAGSHSVCRADRRMDPPPPTRSLASYRTLTSYRIRSFGSLTCRVGRGTEPASQAGVRTEWVL